MSVDLLTTSASSARRTAYRAVTALVASVALLLGGALTVAPAAHAIYNSSVSGTLTDSSGGPLSFHWLQLVQLYEDGDSQVMDGTETDEDGAFAFEGIEDGVYTLYFDGSSDYPSQHFGNNLNRDAPSARIVVGQNQDVTANFKLSTGSSVSGTVRTSAGTPMEDVRVRTYRWVTDDGLPYWDSWDDTYTNADGTYTIEGQLNGVWTVRAYGDDGYLDQYFGGTHERDDAARFTLNGADKTGVNFALVRGGTVAGTVTTPTGAPYTDGWLSIVSVNADPWGMVHEDWEDEYLTGSDGRYTLDELPAGTYTLWFNGGSGVPGQFLGGVTSIGGATRFTVKLGETTTVNAKLSAKPFVGPSATKVSLSTSSRAYGTASTATVAVTGKAAAAGTVKLTAGSKTIGTKAVVGGKAAFTLPANLAVGKHAVRATFTTSGVLQSSTSSAVLTVTKASSTVSAKANKKGSKLSVKVTAKGVTPSGTYVVKAGKTTVAQGKLKKGKASVKLSGLAAGKTKLKVTYNGSSTVKGSSKKVTVKVKG